MWPKWVLFSDAQLQCACDLTSGKNTIIMPLQELWLQLYESRMFKSTYRIFSEQANDSDDWGHVGLVSNPQGYLYPHGWLELRKCEHSTASRIKSLRRNIGQRLCCVNLSWPFQISENIGRVESFVRISFRGTSQVVVQSGHNISGSNCSTQILHADPTSYCWKTGTRTTRMCQLISSRKKANSVKGTSGQQKDRGS